MSELGRNDYMGESDYGSVDLFGLDEFGQPQGMSQSWGAAIGSATQSGVAIAVKELTAMDDYAEGIGALAGAAVGGAMIAMPNARAAGWTAVISSLVTGGIRQLHTMLSKKEQVKTAVAKNTATSGMGLVEIDPTVALMPGAAGGVAQLNGQGLGLPTIGPAFPVYDSVPGGPGSHQFQGAGSLAGHPPQLVGAGDYGLSQNPAAQQAQLVGPGVSGLGSHYGATLFG